MFYEGLFSLIKETFNLPLNSVARHAKASEIMFRPGIAALYAGVMGEAS